MDLRKIAQSPSFIKFTLRLAQTLPEKFAHRLLRFGANQIARIKPNVYYIARHNFSHFPGMNGGGEKLDAVTKEMFFNGGLYYYDHYRQLSRSLDTVEQAVSIPEDYLAHIREATKTGQGVLLLGTHTGNFDLGAMAVAAKGIKIQLLSLAAPSEGFQLMNEFRASVGLEVTPITPGSLRKAIVRLKKGGVVATALDWPHPEEGTPLEVFGKPSYAPLGAARLAWLSGARVMIVSFYRDPVEGYKIHNIPPVEMINTGNRDEDICTNANRLIKIFEELVVQHPDQWMMYHPFWPMDSKDS